MPSYFVTCARGLEFAVVADLTAIGAGDIVPGRGGVSFTGDRETLYRANLELRTAVRVLQPILAADVRNPEELYDAVRTIRWDEFMTPDHTLAVDSNVRDSGITHSLYAALKVKDAICDQFVDRVGRRPSVDRDRPMVPINLHIHADHMILSLDSSGDSLHKRGYRPVLTKAPLNEALAAALIRRSGWTHDTPFCDPMCGSGSLPIEAAWMALDRAPGLTRKHFGFMGWLDFDAGLLSQLREEGRQRVKKALPAPVLGSDIRRDAVEAAQGNARAAGIGHLLRFEKAELREFRPPEGPPGTILCNPPYGERIGEETELFGLYEQIGRTFAQQCKGWNCLIFTSNPRLARAVGLKSAEQITFFNGKLECRLIRYVPPS